jgi:hypothetical protein
MISSRCNDRFPLETKKARTLSEIRVDLKRDIEVIQVFGQAIYEVWINEEAVEDGGQQAWEHCIEQARDCDVFIALFNGNAGWADQAGTIGICHAEFEKAYTAAPGKVFIVNIHEPKAKGAPSGEIHLLFQRYIERLRRFDSRAAKTEAQLIAAVHRAVPQATVKMVKRGLRDASRGTLYVGPALAWSRLNYTDRSAAMQRVALAALAPGNSSANASNARAQRMIAGKQVLFLVSAAPDAMSVPTARETVGQPHLSDPAIHEALLKLHGGPVHLIACHKARTTWSRTLSAMSSHFCSNVYDFLCNFPCVLNSPIFSNTSTISFWKSRPLRIVAAFNKINSAIDFGS